MSANFCLTLYNATKQTESPAKSFGLFHIQEQSNAIQSTIWLARKCQNGAKVSFEWDLSYSFEWVSEGTFLKNAHFTEGGSTPADFEKNNGIKFDMKDECYQFSEPFKISESDKLSIICTGNIPSSRAYVGIGLSKSPILFSPSIPNRTFSFTSKTQLYAAFGDFNMGDPVNVSLINCKCEIVFPNNVYKLTYTLDDKYQFVKTQ